MKLYTIILTISLAILCEACQPAKPADIKLTNTERAKMLQAESDRLAHEALCLRVASGELAAMAEMKIRNTVCEF